jgi:hypothetical protein
VDKNTGMVEKTGMMEEWNAGILGKKERKRIPTAFFSLIPSFHYSNIPLFPLLKGFPHPLP